MEHRVRIAKQIIARLGANFSPEIAQAYTRALDALARISDDLEDTLKCNVHTSRHADPSRHEDIMSLAKFLESQKIFTFDASRTKGADFTTIFNQLQHLAFGGEGA